MPYIKRYEDGTFLKFETVEDLENEERGESLDELRGIEELDKEQDHQHYLAYIEQWYPQYTHLKSGDILYIQTDKPADKPSSRHPENDEFNRRVSQYQGGFEDASNDPDFWINL